MFNVPCERCGEPFDPKGESPVFKAGYETMGEVPSGGKLWVDIQLCPDCQRYLRREFYERGIVRRFE